jgi:hypothetical protein
MCFVMVWLLPPSLNIIFIMPFISCSIIPNVSSSVLFLNQTAVCLFLNGLDDEHHHIGVKALGITTAIAAATAHLLLYLVR